MNTSLTGRVEGAIYLSILFTAGLSPLSRCPVTSSKLVSRRSLKSAIRLYYRPRAARSRFVLISARDESPSERREREARAHNHKSRT